MNQQFFLNCALQINELVKKSNSIVPLGHACYVCTYRILIICVSGEPKRHLAPGLARLRTEQCDAERGPKTR